MADIELVIKIPEHLYKLLKEFPSDSNEGNIENVLTKAVEHGTPLPKRHGDLVDISPYKGKVICSRLYSGVKKLIEVDSIEPIIESNKED